MAYIRAMAKSRSQEVRSMSDLMVHTMQVHMISQIDRRQLLLQIQLTRHELYGRTLMVCIVPTLSRKNQNHLRLVEVEIHRS